MIGMKPKRLDRMRKIAITKGRKFSKEGEIFLSGWQYGRAELLAELLSDIPMNDIRMTKGMKVR